MSKLNVMYFTFGETPRLDGVYESQVISLLENTKQYNNIHLYSVIPFVNSGFYKSGLKYLRLLKDITKRLSNSDVKFNYSFSAGPQNLFYSSKYGFNFFHNYSKKRLLNYIQVNDIHVVHCRSYHSAFEAIKLRARFGLEYKVVFDPRGLWPEESCIKKKNNFNDEGYEYLKEIESYILKNANITICLSIPMIKHYEALGALSCELVYASSKVINDKQESKYDELTFCYIGALNEDGWHSSEELFKVFSSIKKVKKDAKLLIVSPTKKSQILKAAKSEYLNDITIVAAKNSVEVLQLASKCHIGLLPFRIPKSAPEEMVGETMVGTKTLEYIASNMIIFANKYSGGARDLIEENNLGRSYDPENITQDDIVNLLTMEPNFQGKDFVNNLFSDEFNAKRYSEIYSSVENR